jgi:DNA repair exonuclease SbcCD nuclease subunit
MAKIALVSDVHLGTRQYGIKERYDDFIVAFERFGQSAIDHKVDAVVIGGDLFDSPRPDAKSVLQAQYVVHQLESMGIHVFGIDGNHDLSNCGWMQVVGAHALFDGTPVSNGRLFPGVKIVGVNYKNGRDLIEAILQMISDGVTADIIVAHFALAEMNGGGSADTGVQELSPLLNKLGVKCVMMGHVHIPEAKTWNGVLYVNPGSTEMKAANEPTDKYYFIVDTDTWSAEPVQIETREMRTVEICDETDMAKFQQGLTSEAERVANGVLERRPFYHVIADDSIDDAFKRISKTIHDTSAIARIVMRSSKARDLAPVVDRKESINTLESAIEARFPKESDEAKHIRTFLASPDPASIRLSVQKFMDGDTP